LNPQSAIRNPQSKEHAMAEAPQHSSTSIRDSVQPEVGPLPELPVGEGAEPYRPVSLLAVAGFLLAVFYAVWVTLGGLAVFAQHHATLLKLLLVLVPLGAILGAAMAGLREPSQIAAFTGKVVACAAVIVGLGSLAAYSGSNPWLLPDFMWGVLLAAALVCWVARARIQASENTLSGLPLTSWGLWLTLSFGLVYSGYLAANIIAVRTQARACAEDFLEQLKKGDQIQAFIRTLPVGGRPAAGRDLRETIELQYNTPAPGSRDTGFFSIFCRNDLVRMVMLGGEETKIEPGSVEWDFGKEAYQVGMNYKVSGPAGSYDARVTAVGTATAGGGRRQWRIDQGLTSLYVKEPSSEVGKALLVSGGVAQAFAREWGAKVRAGDLDEAYLWTLAGEERNKQRAGRFYSFSSVGGLAGLAPVVLRTKDSKAYLEGRQAFANATFLEGKDLWVPSRELKQQLVEDVRKIFAGTLSVPFEFEVPVVNVPILEVKGKRALVRVACRIMMRAHTGSGGYSVEGEIVVDAPHSSTTPSMLDVRVVSMRLVRARTMAPPPKDGPQRPGQ
jgi:hypothetical protein